jgi:hypothetical protein
MGTRFTKWFAREAEFRIVIAPVGSRERVVYEGCTLLSSSGKWTAREVVGGGRR